MGLGIFGAVFSLLYPYVVLHNVKINKFYSHIVFMNMKKSDGRFWEIDLLRGIAIILMVIFHFFYDLNHLKIIYYKLWEGPFDYASKIVAAIFFLLVGLSLTINYNKNRDKISASDIRRKFGIRGLKLLFFGFIITVISWVIIPERFVIFGVLHCIGISIILAIPFISYIIPNILIGSILVTLGLILDYVTFDFSWFIPLGFLPPRYFSIDYFPLFPWFGVILVGLALGNYLYPAGQRRFQFKTEQVEGMSKNICFIGRHSLPIYFLHQPIIFVFIFLALIVHG